MEQARSYYRPFSFMFNMSAMQRGYDNGSLLESGGPETRAV